MCSASSSVPLWNGVGCDSPDGSLIRSAQPPVSVIIPVYNGEKTIRNALRSVIAQTFGDFELIVVNDGSVDGTSDAITEVRDPRVVVITHDANSGAAAARNSGIRVARGHYLAFLDADDCWDPEKLELQLAYMAAQAGRIRLSCTAFYYTHRESGLHEVRCLEPIISKETLLHGCRCSPGSTLVAERSLIREVGYWNEQIRRLEDWDWLLRCALLSPLGCLQQPLATVQARLSSHGHYIHVAQSVEPLRRSLEGVAKSVGGLKSRYIASSGLANELAAAAYRDGKRMIAARHFVEATVFAPTHQFPVVVRVGRRMWHKMTSTAGKLVSRVQRLLHGLFLPRLRKALGNKS